MDDISFDPAGTQPPCQPEPVATSFIADDDARYGLASLDGFVTPAIQQPKQGFCIGRCQLLQRITVDTRDHSANQPSR